MRVWLCVLEHHIQYLLNFNSHTREGVTTVIVTETTTTEFQLTHPWGCDQVEQYRKYLYNNFNSHTREGVTSRFGYIHLVQIHFNSHTREGVTWFIRSRCNGPYHFNSHTREGVTATRRTLTQLWTFQLTHPWGCDTNNKMMSMSKEDFNSHTREGVTRNIFWKCII